MRTPKMFHATLMFICSFCLGMSMFSCEKENLNLNKSFSPSFASTTVAETTPSLPFNFNLIASHCIAGGVGLSVDIENPSEYAFLWEINGGHGGHDMSTLTCLCGDSATVYIMRLADGVSISKSIALPPCGAEKK